ncbi:MAG: hypothetical protein WB822_05995, partial [Rhodoplanes sp.]
IFCGEPVSTSPENALSRSFGPDPEATHSLEIKTKSRATRLDEGMYQPAPDAGRLRQTSFFSFRLTDPI